MIEINWIVWDSCAYGASGWEDSWNDTCGHIGFATLQEAWQYYRENQGNDCYGHGGRIIHQWCAKPESVVARSINTDLVISYYD